MSSLSSSLSCTVINRMEVHLWQGSALAPEGSHYYYDWSSMSPQLLSAFAPSPAAVVALLFEMVKVSFWTEFPFCSEGLFSINAFRLRGKLFGVDVDSDSSRQTESAETLLHAEDDAEVLLARLNLLLDISKLILLCRSDCVDRIESPWQFGP